MSWEPELDELRRRQELAARMGGEERVQRQRATGRLTVRERLDRLVDAGTFEEIGGLAGFATYGHDGRLDDLTPTNLVAGIGRIVDRRTVVAGDDFTVRGGAADAGIFEKQVYAERLANELRLPIVRLVDGTGGGGSVKTIEELGRTYVPWNPGWDLIVDNLSTVPVVAACLGPVAGLGAARVVTSHYSVMLRERSQLFVAGPPVVKWGVGQDVDKEELGGWRTQVIEAGAVTDAVDDEDEALSRVRRVLSYLPSSVYELPARTEPDDDPARRDEELLTIVPRDRRRPYDVRRILTGLFDHGSVFEIGSEHGASLVTAFARLDGYPVAVVANDPLVYGGGMTAAAAGKLRRHVDLADTFHLPVVNLVDLPGFVIGVEAERAGTIRAGAEAVAAIYQATVPWFSVIVRKVFGVAGAAHGAHHRLNLRVAWPSGDWGSLPLEGGIEAAYKRDLAAADDPEALLAEITERLDAVRSPFRTAEAFGIERIVDPRDTRRILTDWIEVAYRNLSTHVGRRARGMRP